MKCDGYEVVEGQLRRTLPETLDLPSADDEMRTLSKRFGFQTPLGHLEQAIKNHADGNWAAASGQLRSFVEGLLNEIAEKISPDPSKIPPIGASEVEGPSYIG